MQRVKFFRNRLTTVAVLTVLGLGAGGLVADASSGGHPRSLGSGISSPTAHASLPDKSACVGTGTCLLFAKTGTATAGSTTVPIWGFTLDTVVPSVNLSRLAGYVSVDASGLATPANTIIMGQSDSVTIELHNELPAAAGNLSLEFPAVAGAPDAVGVLGPGPGPSSVKSYPLSGLAPGTYVYEAGATPNQARQLAMGLSGIIIVRPDGYHSLPIPTTVNLTITPIARTDVSAVITNGSAVVTDPNSSPADVGGAVSGPGIPGTATVASVVNGVSFTMSAPALPTGVSIGARIDAGAYVTFGSATVNDPDITVADAGTAVTGPGIPSGSIVGPGSIFGTTFVLRDSTDTTNVLAGATGATVTPLPHVDPSHTVLGSTTVQDAAIGSGDNGAAVSGPAGFITVGTTIASPPTVGVSFVMSAPATATSEIAPSTTAYPSGLGAFGEEALLVMTELDPAFSTTGLAGGDVQDYTPKLFFINGKAHPATDDIAAMAGHTVLLRAANLGIRDRALGLLNLRMKLVGDDSHQLEGQKISDIESKLLTPGQVADVTTLVDPSAATGAQFPVLDLSRHLNNSDQSGIGGMLTFIDVVGPTGTAGGPVAKSVALNHSTNDGSVTTRADTGASVTNGSAVVTDPGTLATDVGASVSGPGIPGGAMIAAVTPGTSFTMSAPATPTGVTITPAVSPHPAAAATSGSFVVTDPLAALTDVGATVSGTGVAAGAVVTLVTPGIDFTMDVAAIGDIAGVLLTLPPHTDSGASTTNTSAVVTDPGVLDTDVGASVSGPGIPAGATILTVTTGTNFTMSAVATPTGVTITSTMFTNMTVSYVIVGTASRASWYLDDLGGGCTGSVPFSAGTHTAVSLTIASLSASAPCLALWTTGDHVIWIQPFAGALPGTPSGDVFTLALHGPSISGLAVDPQFLNPGTTLNKVQDNPPGGTDVLLTGSAQPSLLDYTLDNAEACVSVPNPSTGCPAADTIPLTLSAPIPPSHVYALQAAIPAAGTPWPTDGLHAIYVRAHELPAVGTGRWSVWGSSDSIVPIVIDSTGPSVSNYSVSPYHAGVGNYPGNLNFLESVRVQVDIADSFSPIADAELFLYSSVGVLDGTGSQLRPLAGQWLDNLTVHARTAYLEIPVSELQSQAQGSIDVYIHAKDAAGNWGPMDHRILVLDKTNPMIVEPGVDVPGSHRTLLDETFTPVLSGGTITVRACDPNGVTPVGTYPCPATSGALATNPVTSWPSGVQVRYHVNSVTGTIGTAGAGIFYQSAQMTVPTTVSDNGDGTYTVTFEWDLVPQPPLPIDGAISVFVWVLDGAGNPSEPIEVPVSLP